jgi:hypothetical protein
VPLTRSQVASIGEDLQTRVTNALDHLESQKSPLGYLSGNNDTIEQSEGALRNIRAQLLPWLSRGNDIADAETAAPDTDDTRAVSKWQSAGQSFVSAVSEVDGYGSSASLASVLSQTVVKSANDIGDGVKTGLKFGTPLLVLAVVGVVLWKLS